MNIDQLKLKIKQDIADWDPAELPVATHVTENLLEILALLENSGAVGTDAPPYYLIMAYDHQEKLMKTAKASLKTLTDWVIQNFEPSVPVIYDKQFNNVMGGILHGGATPQLRVLLVDELHGKFYVLGAFDTYKGTPLVCCAGFHLDGSPDIEFNANMDSQLGVYLPNIGYSGVLHASFQSDGKIFMTGRDSMALYVGVPGIYKYVTKMLPSGLVDVPFMTAIGNGLEPSGSGYYPRCSIMLRNDKALIGADNWIFNGVAIPHFVRLNANGSIDMPYLTAIGSGFDASPYSMAEQADGKVVISGVFNNFNGLPAPLIIRLNADGTRDTSFDAGVGTGLSNNAYGIAIQPDGKILLGMSNNVTYNGVPTNGLIRLNPDGTVDTAFMANWGVGIPGGYVPVIKLQADGKILIGGNFTTVQGVVVNYFARILSTGLLDTTYATQLGTGFNGGVGAIAVQSNGRIMIAGSFNSFNGVSVPSGIVRLLPNLPPPNVITSPW